ncbi:MAG: FG-GAP-like repeat-containing protein, partial [Isosphaeraceae bacterium]
MTTIPLSLKRAGLLRRDRQRRHRPVAIAASPRFRPRFEVVEDRTLLSTFLVNTTADSGPGSLRQAILDSNAATGKSDVIDFAIAGGGVQKIAPLSPLPTITSPVLIDGTSQPDYAGTPLIELNGSHAGGGDGLTISAAGVTVCGLDVDRFSQGAGIHLTGVGATGDWIYANFLGTDPTGTMAEGNQYGVEIDAGATNNLIGTNGDGVDDVAQRNVISGNGDSGVLISGQGTDGNVVAGDFIGTDLTGTVALGNSGSNNYLANAGVSIEAGASGNWIGVNPNGGAAVADEGNLISGNDAYGIQIFFTSLYNSNLGSNDNVIAGDKIGTDVTGAVALGNAEDGVLIQSSSGNTIGGTGAGEADIISANGNSTYSNGYGIQLSSASDTLVEGNIIGTDATGTKALGNGQGGVEIDNSPGLGATDNTIGGATAIAGNLITDNDAAGVIVTDNGGIGNDSVVGNQITANRIFGNMGQAIDLDDDGVTENSTTPRLGANMLQNFPIIVTTASGQLEGCLGYGVPDASYEIDLFASAKYGPGGSGEAEDFLGSLEVTTNSQGDAVFNVPYTPPAGLPIVTATATDPQGNTSEVSALRQTALQAPSSSVLVVANQSNAITTNPADAIGIRDPDAGPLEPAWSLTLSVSNGSLSLPAIAGLTGSGDGTASLSYSGGLSALNEALEGLIYTPPAGPQVLATVSVGAASVGTPSLATQFVISDGLRLVDTTADSGPGSLRQAILDANTVAGQTVTFDFAIPGSGVKTIELASPLPAIAASVSIDGSSQPEFAGAPLIALGGESTVVTIATGSLTVRGISLSQVAIDAPTSEQLLATEDSNGLTTGLTLLDSQGQALVRSDALSTANRESALLEYLAAGTYSVVNSGTSGVGNASLSISLTPASSPTQPIPVTGLPTQGGGGYPVDQTIPIVTGDFTGNGILDIATPTGLYLGLGDGAFQYPPISLGLPDLVSDYALLVNYTDIIADDFTGHGKLDLALTDRATESVVILLGNGNGTFQPPMSFEAGFFPQSLVAGDFTGNGKLDLAVADLDDTDVYGPGPGGVSILLGNGDGTFRPPTFDLAGNSPVSVIAGDFNGDGKLDLAVADDGDQNGSANNPGGVSVLLGNGNGTFQPAVTYGAGGGPASLVAGDFTGNGTLDLAVADPGDEVYGQGDDPGGVYVLLGNGDGTFQTATVYASGGGATEPGSIVAGDFTGNGKLDLAVASDLFNELLILPGNGDGTFQPPIETPLNLPNFGQSLFLSIVAGDFNRDGRVDVAVADDTTNGFGVAPPNVVTDSFEVLLGNGDGTFEQGGGTLIDGGTAPLITADFNGDGNLDLATYNYATDEVSISLGNGGGGFQLASQFALGAPTAAGELMVAGDFNGDGRIDLAAAAPDGVFVLLGNGDGTFQPATTYSLGFAPTDIVAGDFSNNGILDLAAIGTPGSGQGGELAILMGKGDGTFRETANYPVGANPGNLLAGDFAGNGKLDLAFSIDGNPVPGQPIDGQSNTVSVMAGNGDGTFQPPVNYDVVSSASIATISSIVAEDFTGDGKLDLLVAAAVTTNGTLGPLGTFFFGDTVSILTGNGDGTFQASRTLLKLPASFFFGVLYSLSLIAGDFNGDGIGDVAFVNQNTNQISVLLGNSAGTAQSVLNYPANGAFSLFAGDFAGNGKVDLALFSASSVTILLSNGDGTFTSASQLAITPRANPLVADVNGDGTDDVFVINGSGEILYRQGVPGQPGTFEPPVIINPPLPDGTNPYASRDIAWLPNTDQGPVLASVDTQKNAIIFYAYRDGNFVRLSGSLPTGQFPAQIVAADLNGDGLTDLVVRNAGDATLSVYFGSRMVGPVTPFISPTFTAPLTISVGLGVSDVQAVDTTGSGALDLVITDELTGQVSILRNLGNGSVAPPVPYRAGTGLSAIDPGSSPEVTSLEATAGVAAGPLTPGGPTSLVTINPGSNTLDVLAGLGGGRFANPVALQTQSPAQVVRIADFNHDGI